MEAEPWLAFLRAIQLAKADLKCKFSGAWLRDVTKSRYRLHPSLPRPHGKISVEHERDILEDSEDFEASCDMSSWERLVTLQHNGVPTRLLDWTEVFAFALYFALGGLNKETPASPAIWLLNPFTLFQCARKSNDKRIGVFHRDNASDYFQHFLAGAQLSWPFEAPMPYRPPKLDRRIRAQRGFFTVHSTEQKAIPFAREFLELAGIDSLSLFPDYTGFVGRMRDRY
jgi:hypothetical protein